MINSTEIQDSVRNYIQTAPEVNLSEMLNALRDDGVNITRPTALRALRNEGLEPYNGVSINGERARLWRKIDETKAPSTNADESAENDADETDGASDAPKQNKIESNIARLQDETGKLSSEKASLFDLVQKSVELKKSIREQQRQLLLEMSQLVQAMYNEDSDEQ